MPLTATIRAVDVAKAFPSPTRGGEPIPVLRGISLAVDPGELVAIVGPSGSGKSTLLHCLAGLDAPSGGVVELFGRDLGRMNAGRLAVLRRDAIGFVFQQFNLIASLTARENVALPARLAHRRLDRAGIDAALTLVGLSDRGGHRPAELSGGQQQRVAIARVLVARPRIVFADEPTGSLDTVTGAAVLRLLRDYATGERSVVLVTHDPEAAALADRVYVLRDGVLHAELRRPTPVDVLSAIRAAADERTSA